MEDQTYVAVSYPSKSTTVLFREADGMLVGQPQGCTVVHGANARNTSQHVFVDERSAEVFLRSIVPEIDMPDTAYPFRIIERDGEPMIVDAVPGASRVLKIH